VPETVSCHDQRKSDAIEHVALGESGQNLRVYRKGAGWVEASQQVNFKFVIDRFLEVDRTTAVSFNRCTPMVVTSRGNVCMSSRDSKIDQR
jgi:hypothetical protein